MSRLPKTIVKLITTLFALMVLLIAGAVVAVNVSPWPFAMVVRRRFAEGVGVKPVTPGMYAELRRKVRAQTDAASPSRFKSNRLHSFSPKATPGTLPTI